MPQETSEAPVSVAPQTPAAPETPPATPPPAPADGTTTPPAAEGEQPKPEVKDERLSQAWSVVHKREAKLRDERKAFADERKQHEASVKQANEMLELFTKDPVAFVEKNGGKEFYDRLTKRYLNGGAAPVDERVAELERRIAEREAELAKANEEKTAKEQKATEERLLADYRGGFTKIFNDVDRDMADVFGYVLEDEAVAFADAYARQNGIVLTHEEAARNIRDELKRQFESLRGKKALQALVTANAGDPKPPKPGAAATTGPKNLTNDVTVRTEPGPSLADLPRHEAIAVAAQRLREKRKARGG